MSEEKIRFLRARIIRAMDLLMELRYETLGTAREKVVKAWADIDDVDRALFNALPAPEDRP